MCASKPTKPFTKYLPSIKRMAHTDTDLALEVWKQKSKKCLGLHASL